MELTLELHYASAADLLAHMVEHAEQGAMLLPLLDPPPELAQYAPVALEVVLGEARGAMRAEVLQVLSGNGIVVRLTETSQVSALTENAPIAVEPHPPEVRLSLPDLELDAEAEADAEAKAEAEAEAEESDAPASEKVSGVTAGTKPKVGAHIAGSSPVSWSFEQLQATWDQLTVAEKVRVARHGKRPARMMILKGLDKTLHVHVLHNPGVTPEEIAMMASMSSLDPTVLRRIAGDAQWTRHSAVARNLICNPKLTLPQITKLFKFLSRDELSRLARTGKVKQSVKQLIVKKLDLTR